MANARDRFAGEDAGVLLRRILSPAEAQSLVPKLVAAGPAAEPPAGGLAGYLAAGGRAAAAPLYVKVSSKGQVGFLPKANLSAALNIDPNLKVLDEG